MQTYATMTIFHTWEGTWQEAMLHFDSFFWSGKKQDRTIEAQPQLLVNTTGLDPSLSHPVYLSRDLD